jgi:hypothetical protein
VDLSAELETIHSEAAETKADTRAKMLVYLLAKKLISL